MDAPLDREDYRRLLLVVEAVERASSVAGIRDLTLQALEEHLGYRHSVFFVGGPFDLDVELPAGRLHGQPEHRMEEYVERWADAEPFMGAAGVAAGRRYGVIDMEDVYEHLEPPRRACADDFFRPQGIAAVLGMPIPTGLRATGYLGVFRRSGGRFDARDRARLLAMRPHLANLLRARVLAEGNGDVSLRLSRRQREVAELIEAGLSNAEIASVLRISESTVKKHVSAALSATGLSSRTQLARALRR